MKILVENDNDLIKKLQDGDEQALEAIYINNESAFIHWARNHYVVDPSQAKEIFQLSVIALYSNAREKKLQHLTCTVRTYLFAVGKRLLLKQKRREIRADASIHENLEALEVPNEIYANLVDSKKLNYILSQVGEPCKSILEKFYMYGLSMKDIVKDSEYKTEAVIRKKKHQCMQKIKEIVRAGNYTINDFLE
jgi:RNA polymerase sigma factor (sigma-70 family)